MRKFTFSVFDTYATTDTLCKEGNGKPTYHIKAVPHQQNMNIEKVARQWLKDLLSQDKATLDDATFHPLPVWEYSNTEGAPVYISKHPLYYLFQTNFSLPEGKLCKWCGCSLKGAVTIRTQFEKMCPSCSKPNKWLLDDGQKGVGHSIDEDLKVEE